MRHITVITVMAEWCTLHCTTYSLGFPGIPNDSQGLPNKILGFPELP
jgi:hypothetical protein